MANAGLDLGSEPTEVGQILSRLRQLGRGGRALQLCDFAAQTLELRLLARLCLCRLRRRLRLLRRR